MKTRTKRIILGSVIGVVLLTVGLGGLTAKRYVYDPIITQRTAFYIYPNWQEKDFDEALKKVLPNERAMKRVKYMLAHYDFKLDKRAGIYELQPGMSATQVAAKLSRGGQIPVKVTFNNMRTLDQLAEHVGGQLCFSQEDLWKLLQDERVAKSYGLTPETFPAMFLPDTYEFYWSTTPEKFLQRMKNEYDKFWTDERKRKADVLELTPAEVATLASIVEEENLEHSDEWNRIAGLYIIRLRKNEKLQADPTVKFAWGDFTIKRVLNDHLAIESPYNTYKVEGLPPGPIRIPSKRGIDAVLNYESHDYIFMCAKEDFSGYHNFARTLQEHNRNAQRYRAELNRRGIK